MTLQRAGRVVSGLVVLFLAFDGITKVIRVAPVMDACQKMGISPNMAVGIGLLLLSCTVIYVIPRTAIFGAILLTGYLGGAAAAHVIHGSGAFPTCFAIGFGLLVWAGLVYATGYVSLGSIAAAAVFPVAVYLLERPDQPEILWVDALVAAAIIWFHRANIKRLLQGTENRFRRRAAPPAHP